MNFEEFCMECSLLRLYARISSLVCRWIFTTVLGVCEELNTQERLGGEVTPIAIEQELHTI